MTKKTTAAPAANAPADDEFGHDATAARIRAYADSMQPFRGVEMNDAMTMAYARGVQILESLAASASGTDEPTEQLKLSECYDVLHWMRLSEPREPATWGVDPKGAPSHLVGHLKVINALAAGVHLAMEKLKLASKALARADELQTQQAATADEIGGYIAASNLTDEQKSGLQELCEEQDKALAALSGARARLQQPDQPDTNTLLLVEIAEDFLCDRSAFARVVTGHRSRIDRAVQLASCGIDAGGAA